MAVFASLPGLASSWSMRSTTPATSSRKARATRPRPGHLARARAGAKVILGSATPSLESWHAKPPAHTRRPAGRPLPAAGMPSRIGGRPGPRAPGGHEPAAPAHRVCAPPLLAITERVARGEQSHGAAGTAGLRARAALRGLRLEKRLPALQRAPGVPQDDRTLRCHHCGFTVRVPRACPTCGNPDITVGGALSS